MRTRGLVSGCIAVLVAVVVSGCGGSGDESLSTVPTNPGITAPMNAPSSLVEGVAPVALTPEQADPFAVWNAFLDAYTEFLVSPSDEDRFNAVVDLGSDSVLNKLVSLRTSILARALRAELVDGAVRNRVIGPVITVNSDRTFLLDCVQLPYILVNESGENAYPNAASEGYFDVQLVLIDGIWIVDTFETLEECAIP